MKKQESLQTLGSTLSRRSFQANAQHHALKTKLEEIISKESALAEKAPTDIEIKYQESEKNQVRRQLQMQLTLTFNLLV